MPNPITTSDPILAAVAQSEGVTPAFLGDVVDLINRSPSLLAEINQLDATPLPGGGTALVDLQSGAANGGNTYYHAPVINIAAPPSYNDALAIYGGGSLTAGQTEAITPAGTFVGTLAHEIAHWGDPQLGPLYTTGGIAAYPIEQAVATEFASEGKAATSQYTAMAQIQASETATPVPAGMVNGNVLFNVTGDLLQDTGLLQQVQSLAGGPSPYAADVSYLGSQFWNVNVDGGTYLSTMWNGYGADGARNDLGIDEARITGFQVSETDAGTLAGCTIETSPAAGPALTYQISCPVPGQQQARITNSTTGSLLATVGTDVASAAGVMQLSVAASGFAFAVPDEAAAVVQGDDDTLTLGHSAQLSLAGSGNSVTGAAGGTVSLSASASAVIAQNGDFVALNGNNGAVTVSGSAVTLAQDVSASLNGNTDAVAVSGQDMLSLNGNADSVTGSGATVTLSGARDMSVAGNGDTLLLGGDPGSAVAVQLSGNQDLLFGGAQASNLHLTLAGTGSVISLTSGAATIAGAGAGTTVFGGASAVQYGDGGILVMGAGAATVAGGDAGTRQTVFGGGSGLLYQGRAEYADVIGGAGACTIRAGAGGGWYAGGAAGGNLLAASGAGTVIEAGGNNDTLAGAAGGGAMLIAASGNETLYGGNAAGESSMFLGSGADLVIAGHGGSVIDTGSGQTTVFGGGGHDQVWGGSGGSDLFVAGKGGQLALDGFRTGIDHVATGGQTVAAEAQTTAGTLFTLSSGATVQLVGVDARAAAVLV